MAAKGPGLPCIRDCLGQERSAKADGEADGVLGLCCQHLCMEWSTPPNGRRCRLWKQPPTFSRSRGQCGLVPGRGKTGRWHEAHKPPIVTHVPRQWNQHVDQTWAACQTAGAPERWPLEEKPKKTTGWPELRVECSMHCQWGSQFRSSPQRVPPT